MYHKSIFPLSAIVASFLPISLFAHTRYVVDSVQAQQMSTFSPLTATQNFGNISMMLGVIFIIVSLYIFAQHNRYLKLWFSHILDRLHSYETFVPWILRISVGILLISTSVSGSFISPVLQYPALAFTQFVLGFFILAGFGTSLMMLVVVAFYLAAVMHEPYIIGNMEVLGSVVAFLALGNTKPGIDDIFGIPGIVIERARMWAPVILRVSIGISFLYLSLYEKFIHSGWSYAVVNKYDLTHIIPVSPDMWVLSAGIIELFLGIAYITGYKVRLVSAIAFVVITITLFGLGEDVSSHITLFGVISSLFITGAGIFSLDSFLDKHKNIHLGKIFNITQ